VVTAHQQAAAVKTLQRLGYTYHGAELWKPPLGKPPAYIAAQEQAGQMVSDEQIFDLAKQHFGGAGHGLIWDTDPEYALLGAMPKDARWTQSSVSAEKTLAFARALLSASPVQLEGAAPKGEAPEQLTFTPADGDLRALLDQVAYMQHTACIGGRLNHDDGVMFLNALDAVESKLATPARADAPIGEPTDPVAFSCHQESHPALTLADGSAYPACKKWCGDTKACPASFIPKEMAEVMQMTEPELDAALRAEGIDPATAPARAAKAIADAIAAAPSVGQPATSSEAAPAPVATLTDEELADCGLLSELDDGEAAPVGQPAAQAVEVRKEDGNA
jgi:hypothetical protein